MPTAQATSADIVPERGRAQGRAWWQFSLFSLLLLLLAGCAVAAWIGEIRRREAAERELAAINDQMRELRTAVGLTDDQPNVLTVADKKLVHVKGLFAHGDLAWRWRVYLPPGKQWILATTHGAVWDEQRQQYIDQGGGGSRVPLEGEFTLEARVARALDGSPRIELRTWNGYHSSALQEAGLTTLCTNGKTTARWTGFAKQETFPNSGRIDLLRLHRERGAESSLPMSAGKLAIGNVEALPQYGLVIYLEEKSAQLARFKAGGGAAAPAAARPTATAGKE